MRLSGSNMQRQHDTRTEAALYWAAVSLIVCEGLSIEKAADRLGVDGDELTHILHKRQSLHHRLDDSGAPSLTFPVWSAPPLQEENHF
ncbi:hypothetical protein JM946_29335 [Steroidobacter sp. S1-65]|uniref:Uncharacterized protein n=1 Tax=Steroidobacter gossypii TaxID=2805490 RepID=A0ABS1X6P2_9GAMM|nr:hypothetical protein [Steroidobacter gossypii]MBM0108855.1 hypothetical protein [Steroidobacter gossypii]